MRVTKLLCIFFVVLAIAPQIGKAIALPALYRVTDLGALPGADSSYGGGINDLGDVTGESGNHLFLWKAQTGMQNLGGFDGYFSTSGVAINNNGQIAVSAQPATYPPFVGRAARWTNGAFQDL